MPKRTARQIAATNSANQTRRQLGNYIASDAVGVIRADEVLTLDAYCKRMGTTRGHVNESRRLRGMPAHWNGKQVLLSGRELLEWVESLPLAELSPRPEPSEETN